MSSVLLLRLEDGDLLLNLTEKVLCDFPHLVERVAHIRFKVRFRRRFIPISHYLTAILVQTGVLILRDRNAEGLKGQPFLQFFTHEVPTDVLEVGLELDRAICKLVLDYSLREWTKNEGLEVAINQKVVKIRELGESALGLLNTAVSVRH